MPPVNYPMQIRLTNKQLVISIALYMGLIPAEAFLKLSTQAQKHKKIENINSIRKASEKDNCS